MPPTTLPVVSLQNRPNVRTFSLTCPDSSRVGVSTNTRGPTPLAFEGVSSRCSAGSTNAAVLPVPVWADAIRSLPLSTTGMAWRWISVGAEKPLLSTARSSLGSRFNSEKDTIAPGLHEMSSADKVEIG
jgi:hypothetical protein